LSESAGFLGRFQPFHIGHYKTVESLRDEFNDFKIIIGSSEKSRTEDNPLTFNERKKLIRSCFPDIEIISLKDTEKTPSGNREWAEKLEELELDIIVSRNSLVNEIINQYTHLDLYEQELYDHEIYSGTEVRRRIKSGEEWRYLTPKCSHSALEDLLEEIKNSGTQYNFEPGWERKNAFHGTEK